MATELQPLELDAELRRGLRIAISNAVRERVPYVGDQDSFKKAGHGLQVRVRSRSDELTQRELEVLGLWARGDSNEDVSVKLSKSVSSVKTQGQSILRKLGARNRTHAVVIALAGSGGKLSLRAIDLLGSRGLLSATVRGQEESGR